MRVDGKKNYKKISLSLKSRMLLLVLVLCTLLTLGSILKRYSTVWPSNFQKVTINFNGVILGPFSLEVLLIAPVIAGAAFRK